MLIDMEIFTYLHIELQPPIWNGPDVGPFQIPFNPNQLINYVCINWLCSMCWILPDINQFQFVIQYYWKFFLHNTLYWYFMNVLNVFYHMSWSLTGKIEHFKMQKLCTFFLNVIYKIFLWSKWNDWPRSMSHSSRQTKFT